MKKIFAGLLIACLSFVGARAQQSGSVTNHAFALGKGPNVSGYTSLLCGSAQLAVGQAAADPICKTITGDWTLNAAGVSTLATVNANVGTFGSSTNCVTITVDAKGRITAASQTACAGGGGGITQLTGDVTAGPGSGSQVATLATVLSTPGTFGSATQAPQIVFDGKGRATSATSITIAPAIGSVTGLGTGVGTALAVNVGTAGSPVVNGGVGGTPSSMTATNLSGTAASLTAGTATNATNVGITNDAATNASMFPLWVTANTGNLPSKVTSTKLSFNPSTGTLSSTVFSGAGTGLTGTAASLTAGTATNATNVGITDDTTTNASMFPLWVTANTGNLPSKVTSTKLSFNPSTGLLTSTGFSGSGTRLTFTAPVPQVFQTAGSFTYTPMSCTVGTATWTEFEISGGGGGGAGSGTTPGAPTAGGLSSFAGRSCAGGAAGLSNGAPAGGGACTGTVTGDDFLTGGSGGPATTVANSAGGIGGSNPRGGSGSSAPQLGGSAATANTGAGGGGGGTTATALSGGGGGAGGWLRGVIASPSGGTVVIGAKGNAGTAGTGGSIGGDGGSGVARFLDHCN